MDSEKLPDNPALRMMKKLKDKDTKIEVTVRKRLWSDGYRYRKNNRKLYGTPDISFPTLKIVIFLDSCFWHGCPVHFKMPKTNQKYWMQKIGRNIERDRAVTKHYVEEGWIILRFWEHEIIVDLNQVTKTIEYYVDQQRSLKRVQYK